MYSTYKFFQRMYTIMCVQNTQIFNECTWLCIFNLYNILICRNISLYSISKSSKNVHNSIYSISSLLKKVHGFIYLLYTIFRRMYTIMCIKPIQFFKKCTQFCILNIHISRNVNNSVYSTYPICWCVNIFFPKITNSVKFIYSISKPSKNVHTFVYLMFKLL